MSEVTNVRLFLPGGGAERVEDVLNTIHRTVQPKLPAFDTWTFLVVGPAQKSLGSNLSQTDNMHKYCLLFAPDEDKLIYLDICFVERITYIRPKDSVARISS